jgi:hypothetical protein
MTCPTIVSSACELPRGSHAVSLHTSLQEAAEQAASFLAGAPSDQATRFWAPNEAHALFYREATEVVAARQVEAIEVLPREQVEFAEGKLRPIAPIREFITAHPEGVTAAAGTISQHWRPENVPPHLEYERWFEAQGRKGSRFLCPYDLRTVPPEMAVEVMRALGAYHSHLVLSATEDREARLLELFLFESIERMPQGLEETLEWSLEQKLIEWQPSTKTLALTPRGEDVIREWARTVPADW